MPARNARRRRFWLITLPLVVAGGAFASIWMDWWLAAFFAAAALSFATRAYGRFIIGMATVAVVLYVCVIVQQGWLIEHAQPVRGRLEGVEFEKARYRSLHVVPKYTYVYGGRTYRGDTTGPLETIPDYGRGRSYRRSEAKRVAERMALNARPVVYVYERDPSRAYLRREYEWRPYTLLGAYIVFWSLVALGGVAVATGRDWPRLVDRSAPSPSRMSRHELRRGTPPTSVQIMLLIGLGVSAEALVAWLVWHYRTHVGGGVSWLVCVPVLVGMLPLLWAWALIVRAWHIGEARVWVDDPSPAVGDAVRVCVRQPLRGWREAEAIKFGLVCERTRWIGRGKSAEEKTESQWADWEDLTQEACAAAPRPTRVEGERLFSLPADAPPSTSHGESPKVRWTVKVRIKLRGVPQYERDFVITVRESETSLSDVVPLRA